MNTCPTKKITKGGSQFCQILKNHQKIAKALKYFSKISPNLVTLAAGERELKLALVCTYLHDQEWGRYWASRLPLSFSQC